MQSSYEKNKFADSFWMDVICITDLLSELKDDAQTQETSAADEPPKDNKDTVDNYICTLEDDFDFDELLQQTLTPSTDELLLEMRDGEKAVQTSGRRAAELKRLERFGWQRVPDDKSSKRARYNYVLISRRDSVRHRSSAHWRPYGCRQSRQLQQTLSTR